MYLECFDAGYDGSDEWYKLWLRMYHPDSLEVVGNQKLGVFIFYSPAKGSHPAKPTTRDVALAKPTCMIEMLFRWPPPPSKLPALKTKESLRILMSTDNLQLLNEKEEKKAATKRKNDKKLRGKSKYACKTWPPDEAM